MKTILFIGDSITDCRRNRNGHPHNMGGGYAGFVAGRFGVQYPGEYRFLNHGSDGYRSVDLYAYVKEDVLLWKPDYLSILVGVNDVLHDKSVHNGVSAQKYEKLYTLLIEEIREALPGVKFILMEPFITAMDPEVAEVRKDVILRADAVQRVADRFDIPVVKLQKGLDELCQIKPPEYWLPDGVHPSPQFHQYMADQWIQVFYEKVLNVEKG